MKDEGESDMLNKQMFRILLEILVGIILSVIANTIVISIGYNHFYSSGISNYQVKFLGIDVFNIQGINGSVVGTPNTSKMIIMGLVFSLIMVAVAEFTINLKKSKK